MKSKFLILLVLVLLISNVVLLYFYFTNNKRGSGRERMMERFKKEVGLTDEQAKKIEDLRAKQRESLKPMMDSMNALKKSYIEGLFSKKNTDSLKFLYVHKMSNKILDMDKAMYEQLMEVRKICTPNQYAAFDSSVKKMMMRIPEGRRTEKK